VSWLIMSVQDEAQGWRLFAATRDCGAVAFAAEETPC
jgi:hypothetical protein